jgi:hypothetical protein
MDLVDIERKMKSTELNSRLQLDAAAAFLLVLQQLRCLTELRMTRVDVKGECNFLNTDFGRGLRYTN